jgi:hypothetical protein
MPEMQEQFPAQAMNGGLSRPSTASDGPSRPSMVFGIPGLLPTVYSGNAVAISGAARRTMIGIKESGAILGDNRGTAVSFRHLP